ncbi:MAG: hypothetical protein LBK43_02565 [Treponema sp.]|nr:hypothetical protein [Treponema sp.]
MIAWVFASKTFITNWPISTRVATIPAGTAGLVLRAALPWDSYPIARIRTRAETVESSWGMFRLN